MAWTTSKSATVDGAGFCEFCYSSDLSGCEAVKAAVTGKSIYLTSLSIHCLAAITVTVGEGETTGAVTTAYATWEFTTGGSGVTLNFRRPVKLTAATALCADASGAGNVTIVAQGYVK